MNVVRSGDTAGVYHVYWKAAPGQDSRQRFKHLIGFLKSERIAILVGGPVGDPRRLLTVGPLTEAQEMTFHSFFVP